MLTITEAAFKRLSEMMEKLTGGDSLRIVRKGKRTKVTRGTRRPGDTEVTHNDKVVLRFGDAVANQLTNKTLDVRQTEHGIRLGLRGMAE